MMYSLIWLGHWVRSRLEKNYRGNIFDEMIRKLVVSIKDGTGTFNPLTPTANGRIQRNG